MHHNRHLNCIHNERAVLQTRLQFQRGLNWIPRDKQTTRPVRCSGGYIIVAVNLRYFQQFSTGDCMARDNFSARVKQELAGRVGYRCSNPDCRALTSGPKSTPEGSINLGVAAHITAAASGGPRYNPLLTSDERSSINNAIWLCQSCSQLIDKDPDRFTEPILRRWKTDAESRAACELGVPGALSDQTLAQRLDFVVTARNIPPFAFAFMTDIPEELYSIGCREIQFRNQVWVDRALYALSISNFFPHEVLITDFSIDVTPINLSPKTGLQFIEQGARQSLEFLFDLSHTAPRPMLLEQAPGSQPTRTKFFETGSCISVEPRKTERLLLSYANPLEAVSIKTSFCIEGAGVSKTYVPDGLKNITIVPSSIIPDNGRKWRIHLDGRASGDGFTQDMRI